MRTEGNEQGNVHEFIRQQELKAISAKINDVGFRVMVSFYRF